MLRRKMSQMCYLMLSVGTIAATVAIGTIAQADYITGVTIEGVSSVYDTRVAEDTINGAGLSGGYHIAAVNGAGSWLTDINLSENNPWIIFDLGGNYNLTSLHLWNYNEPSVQARSAKDVDIFTSAAETSPSWDLQGTMTFKKAIGSTDEYADPGEEKNIVASNVRLVKLQILNNYYDYVYPTTYEAGEVYDYNAVTGIGEIRFTGTLVPEPSGIALVVCGLLGLLAYAWRRQK